MRYSSRCFGVTVWEENEYDLITKDLFLSLSSLVDLEPCGLMVLTAHTHTGNESNEMSRKEAELLSFWPATI